MSDFQDLRDIKQRINDENRIGQILEAIGCEYINEVAGLRVEAQLPERFHSDNRRSVQIYMNEHLTSSIRSRPEFARGEYSKDIFSLISFIHHDKRDDAIRLDLNNSKTFICELLGWNEYIKGQKGHMPRVDYTAGMKAILRDKKKRREIKPNPVLDESVLNDYFYYGKALPYQKWIDEGISYDTQMMYGIGFDIETRRVTIPLRNRFGQLVGLKGRIMRDEDDHRKYMYILRCQNRYEWFNFHYAHPYILMDKKVFIFEAEKSPMIAFDMGIFNTVGIGASEISDEQVQIIKQLGLDIEIVLCYDKGISLDDIQAGMELFEGRTVYAIYDKDDLLDGKDSPVDEGKEKWDKLVADYTFTLDEIKKMNELSKEDEKKVEKEVYIIEEWE